MGQRTEVDSQKKETMYISSLQVGYLPYYLLLIRLIVPFFLYSSSSVPLALIT